MNQRAEMVCVWSATVFAALALIGFIVADYIPPMSPNLSAEEVAAILRENTLSMRFAVLLIMTSGAFMCPFAIAITMQLRRIEGGLGPYSLAQACAGSITALIFVIASVFWTAALFRPDAPVTTIRMLNDLGWITALMTFGPFIVQNILIGLCILSDRSESPVLPRWVGYYNLWVAVSFAPGGLLTFFKTGPFAWDGLFVWWIPFVVFFSWWILMFIVIRSTVKKQIASGDNIVLTATA